MMDQSNGSPTPFRSAAHDFDDLAARALRIALAVNVVIPLLLFVAIYLLKSAAIIPSSVSIPTSTQRLLFIVMALVAVSEVAVGFIVRKALFAPAKLRLILADADLFAKMVMGAGIVLAALGAASMVYGIVLYALGAPESWVAVFGLIGLVHFRLLRPTSEFLRAAATRAAAAA
ncbi:MAG TPA: hypothetical protein VNN55_01520 [bacterium]|nr:hypothetical protein [bacterium]